MKTRRLSKSLAILLALVLVMTLLPMSALATVVNTATFTFSNDANITTAVVAGSGTGTLKILETVGPQVGEVIKTCQVELSPNSTASSATITLKNGNTTVDTLSVTLPTTVPTEASVTTVSKSIVNSNTTTTYEFVFVKETSYTGGTNNNGFYIELPDPGVELGTRTTVGNVNTYSGATTSLPGVPQLVSLRLVPAGSSYDNVSDGTVSINSGSTSGVSITHQAGSYYVLNVPSNNATAKFTVGYKLNGVAQTAVSFSITMQYVSTWTGNSGVCAYLPAPGQFTNEGITTGGWGDAFTNSGTLKSLVDSNSSTGVSLGAFGGYTVFDFGEPTKDANGNVTAGIFNDATNKYGVDFIVYGNAFNNNAEPGCIQVSVDGNKWYDIAGSLHYASGTIWDYSATYTNPTPADDALSPAANNLGTLASVLYSYTYRYTNGVMGTTVNGNGTVGKNNFHNHSWFPLQCNYFTNRNSFGSGGLANLALTSEFAGHTLYNATTSTAATATFSGVKIPFSGGTNDNYLFGYADCHANGSYSATQVNPYTAGRTSGGDPIDISWAVYPAGSKDSNNNDISGQPVNLSSIRYVRVYTGAQAGSALFGETSTEITGVYRATATGTGAATTDLQIWGETQLATTNMGTLTVPARTYYIVSSESNVYVDGVKVDASTSYSLPVAANSVHQIITQNGTESPYIVVIKGT